MARSESPIRAALARLLTVLSSHGEGELRGYARCPGSELLTASDLSLETFRDAIAIARDEGLVDVEQFIPTTENQFNGVPCARLTPKGREVIQRAGAPVASPIDDARSIHRLLANLARGERALNSTVLANQLAWPPPRVLEAADVLAAQGLAKFARRTMNNFFILELTPKGRL